MQKIVDSIREQLNNEIVKDVINTDLVRMLTKSLDAFQSFGVNSVTDPRLGFNILENFDPDNIRPIDSSRDIIADLGHIFTSYMNTQKGHADIIRLMDLYTFFNNVLEKDNYIGLDKITQVITMKDMILDNIIKNVSESNIPDNKEGV